MAIYIVDSSTNIELVYIEYFSPLGEFGGACISRLAAQGNFCYRRDSIKGALLLQFDNGY
jgi:hypothetical protein